MARFEIKSKDGNSIRYSGKPRYNGSYLKPSFLEFSEIASSTPIQWEVGDYVDYPRTGMRYRLYSIPQPSKNARKGAVGNSFTYSNVQFFSATKELEIALFRDLVDNDNNIHFSTSPDVATFENVEGIIRRIQVCMNDLYPDRWEIRLASFDANEDAEVIERIAEPRDFALSGGTCLDALSKIYDLWDGIGWFHSHENGKEIITVGYANTRNAGNTTESYLYGKGNGLTAIKKHQTNKEEFATRLYVYGSERNLPSRYYNEKNILNAESVDIRNLMLPLDSWGKTDGLPDARKAYLENAEAVAKFGVIPKVHYFDSVDAGADIYPTIEGMTIGRLRKALEALGDLRYYPSASLYPDATKRVDEVRSCENPDDAGVINPEDLDKEEVSFVAQWGRTRKMSTGVVSDTAWIASFEFSIDEPTPCEVVVNPNVSGYIDDKGFDSVTVTLRFRDHSGTAPYNPTVRVSANKVGDKWEFMLPNIRYNYAGSPRTIYPVYLDFVIEAFGDSPEHASYILNDGTITYSLKPIQDETFVIQLDEIGFNIDEMALKGKGKTISMKTGSCAGRSFVIKETRRKGVYWNLICKRQQDNTLGLLFPNSAYGIAGGDRFVLLDIAMPETYVYAASDRLLAEGEKLLARASRIQNHYEPAIDAKVMIESGRTLREGMFMSIEDEDVVDNTTDYIIIDTLSIYEDESAIPTYRVTLRERRKVTYKGTPSATSATDTQPVEKETNETTAPSFESFWEEDENGNVFTTRQIRIKNNLIVEGDTASGGNGDPGTVVGATSVVVDGVSYPAVNGVIDISKAFEGLSVDVDLTDYYTKSEVNELIDGVTSGDIDLANYYTKSQVDDKFDAIDFSPYAKKTDVEGVETRVSTLEKAGYATKGYVDTSISALVNGAPSTLDTLKEIADAFEESQDVIDALDKAIGTKASQTSLDSAVERIGTLESTLKTEQGNIDTLEGYFASGIAKKATADAKGNVIDTYYTPIATHNAFKESTNATLALKASASDLSALSTRVGANEGSIASLQSGKADKATTLAGYGIKDAYTTTQIDTKVSELNTAIGKKADASSVYTTTQIDAKVQTINNALALRYTKTEVDAIVETINDALADRYTKAQVDGIVTTINNSITSVDNKYASTKTWADTLASLIVNENGNIRIKTNLIVNGDTASGGGSGESAIGITGILLNGTTYRDENGDGIIDLGTITSGLTSVNWSDVQGRPTSLSQFNNDLGLGTLAYKNGLTASDVGALSTAGGTIDSGSNDVPLVLKSSGTTTWLRFTSSDGAARYLGAGNGNTLKYLFGEHSYDILTSAGGTISGDIEVTGRVYEKALMAFTAPDGTTNAYLANELYGNIGNGRNLAIFNAPTNAWYTLLHTGNYSSYVLPLSGGTIEGALTIQSGYDGKIVLDNTDQDTKWNLIYFKQNGEEYGRLGTAGSDNVTWNGKTILHAGNYSDYALSSSGGTINGLLTISRSPSVIKFAHGTKTYGFIGVNTIGPVFYDPNSNAYDILTSAGGTINGSLTLNEGALYVISSGKQYAYNVNTGNGEPIYLKNDAWQTLLHSGNYSDYALPKAGGTIDSTSDVPLTLDGEGSTVRLRFSKAGTMLGYFAFAEVNTPLYMSTSGTQFKLIHSGNIGDYNAGGLSVKQITTMNTIPTAASSFAVEYNMGKTAGAPANHPYGYLMNYKWPYESWASQIYFTVPDYGSKLFIRGHNGNNNTWSDWREVAFTDSNITGNAAGLYGGTSSNKYYFEPWTYGYQLRGAYPILRFRNTNSQNSGIEFANNSDITRWSFSFRGQNNANEDFYFYKALEDGSGIPVMAFDYSSGNVLIGTTTDNGSGAKLYVEGTTCLNGATTINGNITLGYENIIYGGDQTALMYQMSSGALMLGYGVASKGYSSYLNGKEVRLRYGSSMDNGLILNSSGNITIGSRDLASVGYKLFVDGILGIGGSGNSQWVTRFVSNSEIGLDIQLGRNANNDKLPFSIAWRNDLGTPPFTINPNGNVGIGTTNPACKLEVIGDVRINGNLIVTGDTASGGTAGATTGGVSILTINGNIPIGSSISQSQLDAIGFTSEVLTDLMNGKYVYVKNVRSNGSFSLMALSANGSTIYMKEGSENFEMIEYVFFKSSSTTWRIEVYEV